MSTKDKNNEQKNAAVAAPAPKKTRRPNGEGTVTTRSDGVVMGRYYDLKGKRQTIYGPKGSTESQMWARIHTITEEVRQGEHITPEQMTVAQWMISWDERYARPTMHDSTYSAYRGHVYNHIIPQLGHLRLQSLDVDILQDFFNDRVAHGSCNTPGEALSLKTVRNIYNTCKVALDQAVDARKIKYNPITGVRLGTPEDKEMRVLGIQEQEAVSKAALLVPELHAFGIIFAMATGVREGELLALKWADLNEKEHSIHIKRSVGRITIKDPARQEALGKKTELRIGPPKTKKSKRKIALFDELWEDLMEYKRNQSLLKLEYGDAYENGGWIFANPLGKIIDPRTYQDLFHRVVKRANVEYANFHSTRHTFATRALENGMDIKVLSAILGHAQTSTTLNKYGHALPEHVKISMDKMKELYAKTNAQIGRIGMDAQELAEEKEGNTCQIIYFGNALQTTGPVTR